MCQPHSYATDPQTGLARLRRFKWGMYVSFRAILVSKRAQLTTSQRPYVNGDSTSSHDHPHVDNWYVPSCSTLLFLSSLNARTHAGFDKLMPEGRHAPWKYLPRPGAHLSVTFGAPMSPAVVRSALSGTATSTREEVVSGTAAEAEGRSKDREVRIAVTEVVQRAVEALGRQVSGNLLTGPGTGPPLRKDT